jgi:hypothetical protein
MRQYSDTDTEEADRQLVERTANAPITEPTEAQRAIMAMARMLLELRERLRSIDEWRGVS